MFEQRGKLALITKGKPERILIAGDIHGGLSVFRRIITSLGPRDLAIFLGDYADRGSSGLEVLEELIEATRSFEGRILPLKGNHENFSPDGKPLFHPCTLITEAMRKGREWKEQFRVLGPFFESLALAALIPGFAILVHGGISKSITSPDSIETPAPETETDIIWGDPGALPGQHPSPRGAGHCFGQDITERVLKAFGVTYLIRSHQPRKAVNGPYFEHGGSVVTTSATSVYGGIPFMFVLQGDKLPRSQEELTSCVEYLV